jgi:hypothetical protein
MISFLLFRINESAEIQSSIRKMKIVSWGLTLAIPIIASQLCLFIWRKIK